MSQNQPKIIGQFWIKVGNINDPSLTDIKYKTEKHLCYELPKFWAAELMFVLAEP